jgi:hypothetical protein
MVQHAPVTLDNEHLSRVIHPECGGKCRSIVKRNTGRDRLWHNPHLAQVVPEYGQPYFNLGLEPSTAPVDAPDWDGPLANTPGVIRWGIELRIT